jgi:hypothetical protein
MASRDSSFHLARRSIYNSARFQIPLSGEIVVAVMHEKGHCLGIGKDYFFLF